MLQLNPGCGGFQTGAVFLRLTEGEVGAEKLVKAPSDLLLIVPRR